MKPVRKKTKSYEDLRAQLKLKNFDAQKNFKEKYRLADEFLRTKQLNLGKIRDHSAKLLGTGALTGTLLLSPPSEIGRHEPKVLIQEATRDNETDIKVPGVYVKEILESLPIPTR